ncbi:butyrophilin-like protein 8 isoform X6 [Sebastes fasciatus]|uniref:butyrophilin-like protein 8 isoform X6 n=1 Tax=Sebastes fasciatus TaxID=394691 RepID=UPI003D9DD12A
MKMICSILLLLSLTSCVSGAFVVNVTQTSYQAEENHNITLEWMFTTRTNSSSNSLFILCRLLADLRPSVLFHLREGVEVPESQDKQFAGRVRWDKDVLRDGRIRLHMSRLRINDSGVYMCDVSTGDGRSSGICHLKVTAAADEPKPLRPTMRPQPESQGRIALYVGLVLPAALLVLYAGFYFAFRFYRRNINTGEQMMSFSEEQPIRTNQVTTSSAEIRSCLEGNLQAAKTCENSDVTRCRATYPNLNHSRSMPNFNSSSL